MNPIPTDISWKRRLITTSAWFALAILMPASLPLTLPLALLWGLVARDHFSAARALIFLSYFFVLECTGLLFALVHWLRFHLLGLSPQAYERANRRVQRWWSRGLFWTALKLFGARISVKGLDHLDNPHPAVILCRHASTLDTMLPLGIASSPRIFAYVIKSELLADPALDYVAQRIPNVFVNRGTNNPEAEVQKILALARDHRDTFSLVLYPEGTRFSPAKRQRLLDKFAASPDKADLLATARALTHTLPPLRDGALKLVEHAADKDLVFIAHRGIDRVGSMAELFTGALTHAHLEVNIWRIPAAQVPRDPELIAPFILEHWQRINDFVAAAQTHPTTA
ncbi:lysophospholipid acyltransferase family protein [Lujinxingia litoralis]|nr:lysophospholipid acyltransferase family protein [Lujinxingia litoralis]